MVIVLEFVCFVLWYQCNYILVVGLGISQIRQRPDLREDAASFQTRFAVLDNNLSSGTWKHMKNVASLDILGRPPRQYSRAVLSTQHSVLYDYFKLGLRKKKQSTNTETCSWLFFSAPTGNLSIIQDQEIASKAEEAYLSA